MTASKALAPGATTISSSLSPSRSCWRASGARAASDPRRSRTPCSQPATLNRSYRAHGDSAPARPSNCSLGSSGCSKSYCAARGGWSRARCFSNRFGVSISIRGRTSSKRISAALRTNRPGSRRAHLDGAGSRICSACHELASSRRRAFGLRRSILRFRSLDPGPGGVRLLVGSS